MANPKYNFDEELYEYVEFTMRGHEYRLKLMTVEELQEFGKLIKEADPEDSKVAEEFLYKFIEAVGKAPPIVETLKKLLPKQSARFTEMIYDELAGKKDNKSTKTS